MPTPVSNFSNLVTATGDWTAAINAAQAVENDAFLEPKPGQPYRIEGKLNFTRGRFAGTSDSVIEHYPKDDNTSAIVVTGEYYGRMLLEGFVIKGQQNGHVYGQDLIKIAKGDYNTIRDVTIDSPVRDGVHVEPSATGAWVENTRLENVKVYGTYGATNRRSGNGFHFEVPNNGSFINNTTMSNCETRSVVGSSVYAETKGTTQNGKIGIFNIVDGSELAASGAVDTPIIHFVANAGAPIENVNIYNTTVEDTGSLRTGPAIRAEGRITGVFNFLGGTYHGTDIGVDVDETYKPQVDIQYIQSGSQIYRKTSLLGVKHKYRTLNLAPNEFEDVSDYTLNPEEILEGYVKGRYNGIEWFAKFTVWGNLSSCIHTYFAQNCAVSIAGGKLRITNLFGTAPLEVWLQCPVRDNSF